MARIDLRELDLNLLVVLERLLARGGVGAAAADLGLSQPAVSRSLQRLRDTLGDPLLVRVGHEMVPTERALELREAVEDALQAARRVFEPPATFDPRHATGAFVIALGDEAQIAVGPAIAAAVWAHCPGIDLRFHQLSARTVAEGRRGDVDLALSPDLGVLPLVAGGVDTSEFVHRRLYTRRFVVIARAGTPPLDLASWLAADHVIVSFEAGGRGFVDDLLAARGLTRRVAASVTSFVAAAHLVASSRLVGVVPAEVAGLLGDRLSVSAPPIDVPSLPIELLWHPRVSADPRHRFVRERVAEAVIATLGGAG